MRIVIPNKLSLISCSVAESDSEDGATWSSTQDYAVDDLVRCEHVKYKCVAANKGKKPSENWSGLTACWQKIGATNPYRMIDEFVETQTQTAPGQKLIFRVPFVSADSVALLNIHGASLALKIIDEGIAKDITSISLYEYIETPIEMGCEVFGDNVTLIRDIDSISLYKYYFDPIDLVDVYVNTNLPKLANGVLEVTIFPIDDPRVVKLGHVIVGSRRDIGVTKYGAESGVSDYSKKIVDDFGVTTLVKRSYSKNASLSLFVSPKRADFVANTLSSLRSTPVLIQGSNSDDIHKELNIYGWLEDWRQVYSGPQENEIRLEIQGLI